MVAMNFTFAPAENMIPDDLKLTTIRKRNHKKEEQLQRIKSIELYWKQRTPECKLLGIRKLKSLTVIEESLAEFIIFASEETIYKEGFGNDRQGMLQYFRDNYKELTHEPGAFYIVEWYPESYSEVKTDE